MNLTICPVRVIPMRMPRLQSSPSREAVYGLASFALLAVLFAALMHDDRYLVDHSCVKYASAKACRVF